MQDPARYESNKSLAARDANIFVPVLMSHMPWRKNETIMDYGCGAGSTGAKFFLPKLEYNNSHMYSLDVSMKMLNHAITNYPSPRITYAVGDIVSDEFPFPQILFDKIFGIYVLHYIKDYRRALQKCFEYLKPGGYGAFTVVTGGCHYELFRLLGESERWRKYMNGYEEIIPEWVEKNEDPEGTFLASIENIGYKSIAISLQKQTYKYAIVDELIELIFSLIPSTSNIPHEEHDNFKQEIRKFFKLRFPEQNLALTVDYEMTYFVVQKPNMEN